MLWVEQLRECFRLGVRRRQPELMDEPALNAVEHAQALAGLARVNWFSGSEMIFWPTLREMARRHREAPLRVLDVACGGGDVTLRLARRAAREGCSLQLSGCDISETALTIARGHCAAARQSIEFFRHDVLQQPLPARFDVVICSLFLHHLDEADAIRVLQSMSQAATQGVLINDLIRSLGGYLLAVFGARLLSRSRIVHVDGPLSVAGAFTPTEALRLCQQADLQGATISRHWPQRFLLTWKRP
jgi:2-polyprenyl-3-methyl-5-hydroxy-6-metoxy-1,4-benzoquinol methylase